MYVCLPTQVLIISGHNKNGAMPSLPLFDDQRTLVILMGVRRIRYVCMHIDTPTHCMTRACGCILAIALKCAGVRSCINSCSCGNRHYMHGVHSDTQLGCMICIASQTYLHVYVRVHIYTYLQETGHYNEGTRVSPVYSRCCRGESDACQPTLRVCLHRQATRRDGEGGREVCVCVHVLALCLHDVCV